MLYIFVIYLQVPETPVWLLSRGREKDALKSLCYLRGWTKPEDVKEEFDELVEYSKKLQKCVICDKIEDVTKSCEHYKMNSFKRYVRVTIQMYCN